MLYFVLSFLGLDSSNYSGLEYGWVKGDSNIDGDTSITSFKSQLYHYVFYINKVRVLGQYILGI